MKKYMVLCAGLCLAMAFTGCKSNESAYKQAYEKAKAAESAQQVEETPVVVETPVVTPVQTTPVTQTRVTDNLDNERVREERVSVVSGSGLRAFSVVVGAFKNVANAENLQARLKNNGYAAQLVKNEELNMYRVVASTSDDKATAVASRNELRATYPDAWLLYNKK